MPKLSKRILSAYLKSDCERRFALDLYNHSGAADKNLRSKFGMPEREPTRPGFDLVARAGEEWQYEKVQDLLQTFGKDRVQWLPAPTPKDNARIKPLSLSTALDSSSKTRFLVESEFELTASFKEFFGLDALAASAHNLKFSLLRPDLIYIDDAFDQIHEVLFDGSVVPRPLDDKRKGLRIIDIKLTSEPSAAYFAETVLYSMALAGWLKDSGRNHKYFVRADPSVWPGSYEASPIIRAADLARRAGRIPTLKELGEGLEKEIEIAPIDVFVPRLGRILNVLLPYILDAAPTWKQLPWEVTARCRNCDYLGIHWGASAPPPVNLCVPEAKQIDHLSRIAFVPRGAFRKLRSQSVLQVSQIAQISVESSVFDAHPQLRATRGIVKGRASALSSGYSGVALGSPSSSVLPSWPKVRIFIIAEFDPSSAISVAFAINASWWPKENDNKRKGMREHHEFLVTDRSLNVERDVFISFLEAIHNIIKKVEKELNDPSLQIYIWDTVTYEHLTRLIGRHLDTLLVQKAIKHLAWLFPPKELIANPALIHRGSAIAIVADAVRTSVATPIPHVYSLLNVARFYHSSNVVDPDALFSIDSFYEDPLTSQVPIERIHEFWNPTQRAQHLPRMSAAWDRTLKAKLRALEHITSRLTSDLRATLIAKAPSVSDIKPPTAKQNMAAEAQLVYAFAEFNNALAAQENIRIRSLQADEREAAFSSAKLTGQHVGTNATFFLNSLDLEATPNRHVFILGPSSTEVKAKPGDFSFSLSDPQQLWFLEKTLGIVATQRGETPNLNDIPYFAQKYWQAYCSGQVFSDTSIGSFAAISIS